MATWGSNSKEVSFKTFKGLIFKTIVKNVNDDTLTFITEEEDDHGK